MVKLTKTQKRVLRFVLGTGINYLAIQARKKQDQRITDLEAEMARCERRCLLRNTFAKEDPGHSHGPYSFVAGIDGRTFNNPGNNIN